MVVENETIAVELPVALQTPQQSLRSAGFIALRRNYRIGLFLFTDTRIRKGFYSYVGYDG